MAFTLDNLREAVEKKYAGFPVQYGADVTETVTLRAAIRLSKAERKQLSTLAKKLQTEGDKEQNEDDVLKALADMLVVVADSPEAGSKLVAALNSDLAAIVTLWGEYQAATEPGEA